MHDVSVIIPIYNGEKYLKDCLDSISKQTLNNIEIICIDDGSTDNTLNILKKYSSKDKRFKIISVENNGQGPARNIALNKVNGEYISFVDADDWIRSDALELLYNKAKKDNLDMLFFQMVNFINLSGKYVETDLYNHQCFIDNSIGEIFTSDDTKECLFKIPVGPVTKLYRKEFLDSNNIKFPEGMFFEDNAFFYDSYFKCKKAAFLKEKLYFRRRHNESVTQTFDESKFDIIKATNSIINTFLENDKFEEYKPNVINHTFSMLIEWFKKSPLYLRQNFYKQIKQNFIGFNDLKQDFAVFLKDDYNLIYNMMIKNEFYVDFLTKYKLAICDYEIYSGKLSSKDYKISVIIPIYNNDTLIHRTLMSIENQTFGLDYIEVLMIDDASTDNTFEVIKEYADKYSGFKAVHIKKGTGSPGTPRNIGLKEASGDYVIFIDHDDLFEVDAFDVLYNSITELDCDCVYGTYASIDIDYPTKIVYPNEKHGYFKDLFQNKRSIAFPPPSIWTKLFKREFLIENNILFPTILGEDAIFVSKVLFKADGINYLWNKLICFHVLNKKSYTKNISYTYCEEGFMSEEYMYNLYENYDYEFYKIRGESILDFYLSQFYKSKLSADEIINIFPALYDFVKRIHEYGLTPHVDENNEILFKYILNKDVDSIIKFKQVEVKKFNKDKLKNIIKKFIKKVIG